MEILNKIMKTPRPELSGRKIRVRVERLVETKDGKYKVNVAQPIVVSAGTPGAEGIPLRLEPGNDYELPEEVAATLGDLVKRI